MEKQYSLKQRIIPYVAASLVGLSGIALSGCNTQAKKQADREYMQRVKAEEERINALPEEQRELYNLLNGIMDTIEKGVGESLD